MAFKLGYNINQESVNLLPDKHRHHGVKLRQLVASGNKTILPFHFDTSCLVQLTPAEHSRKWAQAEGHWWGLAGTWYAQQCTVYPKKYAPGFCFAVLCCGYTLTDFPISIRLTSLALWQSDDCPSASKATLMNMDKYFIWIHYEQLHNHNKAKHNKTVCIFLGIYCRCSICSWQYVVFPATTIQESDYEINFKVSLAQQKQDTV